MKKLFEIRDADRIRAGILQAAGMVNIAGLRLLKPDGGRTPPVSMHGDFVGHWKATPKHLVVAAHDGTVWIGIPECMDPLVEQYCPEGEAPEMPDPTYGGTCTVDFEDLLKRVHYPFWEPKE